MKRRTHQPKKLRDRRTGGAGVAHSPYARHQKREFPYRTPEARTEDRTRHGRTPLEQREAR